MSSFRSGWHQAGRAGPGCRWGARRHRGGGFLPPGGGRASWPPTGAAFYREPMSWMETARDWRPTVHALAGLAAGALTAAVLGGLVVGWLAAIWSLIDGPTGGWELAWFYVVVTLAGPLVRPWANHRPRALRA